MFNTVRTALWLFLICSSYAAIGSIRIDTTKRSFIKNNPNVLNASGYAAYFKEAAVQFRQDSLEKGANLMYTAIQAVEKKANLQRAFPYFMLEFCNIVKDVNSNQLSLGEKRLGLLFLKGLLSDFNKDVTEKALTTDFKHASVTTFTKRLHILLLMFSDPERADKEAGELLKTEPELLTINLLKAENCYQLGEYDKSIMFADKVINMVPDYAHAYTVRGQALSGKNEYEKAIDDFDLSIKYFPNDETAYYEKGQAQINLERYRRAIAPLLFVLKKNTKHPSALYDLARCYRQLYMLDSAMYCINLYINLNREDAYGYHLKGDIFVLKKDDASAIELYTHAISIDSNNSSFYDDRADIYFSINKYQEAISDFKRSLSLNKHNAYINEQVGECYYDLNDDKQAVIYYKKALEINPNYKEVFVGLNRSYNRMGDYKAAIIAGNGALKIDSAYSTAWGDLGWTYYLAGDFDKSIMYSYKALNHSSTATYAMFNIGLATLCKGDFEKAKELYQNFVNLCKKDNHKIQPGVAGDLRDLIKKKKFVTEATFILEHILNEKP